MPEPFDPYYHWLGIPPHEQPPHHYRLLSIQLFEPNPEVIQNAVDRLMAHLRTFQTGQRAAESQRLLNEIARAKICLLDPAKRAAYDRDLKSELNPTGPPVVPPQQPVASSDTATDLTTDGVSVRSGRSSRRRRRRSIARTLAAATACLICLIVAWVGFQWLQDGQPPFPISARNRSATDSSAAGNETNTQHAPAVENQTGTAHLSSDPTRVKADETAVQGGQQPPRESDATDDEKQATRGVNAASDVPADLQTQLAEADGQITDRFAICQTLPLAELNQISEQLRSFGYRPRRIRPFSTSRILRVAAIWTRDAEMAWQLMLNQRREKLQAAIPRLEAEGWVPMEIAGYQDDGPRFAAVFHRNSGDQPSPKVLIGLTAEEHQPARQRLATTGHVASSIQVFVDQQNRERFSAVWVPVSQPATTNSTLLQGTLQGGEPLLDKDAPIFPTDLTLVELRGPEHQGLAWFGCPLKESPSVALLSGFDPGAHRTRWREVADDNFVPVAICVIPYHDQMLAASIWTRQKRGRAGEQRLQLVGALPRSEQTTAQPIDHPTSDAASNEDSTASPDQQSIPASAAQNSAIKALREEFGMQLSQANTPTARSVLARSLIQAAEGRQDVAQRYMLLEMALEQATQAGNIDLAFRAIAQQDQEFELDALQRRAQALDESRTANRYLLGWYAFELAEQARRQQRWEIAERVATMGSNAARSSRNTLLSRALREQLKSIRSAERLAMQAKSAETAVADNTQQADANLVKGKYTCFVREQWQRGLPLLASGSDPALAQIARREMQDSLTAQQQLALADAWLAWTTAGDPLTETAGWQRALKWYVAALPLVGGAERERAEQELASLNASLSQRLWWTTRQLPWIDGLPGTLHEFDHHAGAIRDMATTADGRWVITGGADGTLRVWDLITATETRQLSQVKTVLTDVDGVQLADSDRLAVAFGNTSKIAIWNTNRGDLSAVIPVKTSIRSLAASPTSSLISWSLDASRDENVFVFNPSKPAKLVRSFRWPRRVHCLAFSPDGRRLAAGDRGTIVVWDLLTGTEVSRIKSKGSVQAICFSPNGYRLAAATSQGLFVHDAGLGYLVGQLSSDNTSRLVYLADGRLVTAQTGKGVTLWHLADASTARVTEERISTRRDISALAKLPDPRAVLLGLGSGELQLIRLPQPADGRHTEKAANTKL